MSQNEAGTLHLTAVIRFEDGGYVSVCPELSVASQGDTVEEAKAMLQEAMELVLEDAEPGEYDYLVGGRSQILPLTVSGLPVPVTAGEASGPASPLTVHVG